MMLPPNILITNFCNQNCPFCFASSEMTNKTIKKEIDIKDFKKIIFKMKKSKIKVIKLLGGEPTLHSQFKKIIDLSLKNFTHIQIFTNGIFNDDINNYLLKNGSKIGLTFNVVTPGYLLNKKIRDLVNKRIIQLAKKSKITLSLTFDIYTNVEFLFKILTKEVIKKIYSFRLGIANPIAKEKNFYEFSDFPKIGKKLIAIVKKIRENNKKAQINLNCGFTRCMLTEEEFNLLKKETYLPGFSCFGKEASFDLQTDLTAFHCFPLSTVNKINTKNKNYNSVNAQLIKKRFYYWSKIKNEICLKCPFYGIGKDKCPGPCVAFSINLSKNNIKF